MTANNPPALAFNSGYALAFHVTVIGKPGENSATIGTATAKDGNTELCGVSVLRNIWRSSFGARSR